MPNIDDTDRRILVELQRNARRSNKDLAAMVGVAPSTMLTRVRNLEGRGIIRGYHADVDPAAVGRPVRATVSVRLQPKSRDVVERFVQHVWSLEETEAISLVTGPFDVIIDLVVADVSTLGNRVLNEIATFDAVVDEQTTLVLERRRKPVLEPVARPS
jgi:DNA-binding Lrp family transcriptional regulator